MESVKWPERLFVTGIDTDAGKSYITGLLARVMMKQGLSVITQKFVQTGNKEYSEDIDVHRKIMGIPMTSEDLLHITAPIIYSYPASPHLSAEIDQREIDLSLIDTASDTLAAKYDHLLIEGAGGLMVPLKGDYLTIDYIRDRKLPVVLVTNGRLGSINHTLLSLYALSHYSVDIFAVVYNKYFDKDKIIAESTRDYIKNWIRNHFPDTLYLEI